MPKLALHFGFSFATDARPPADVETVLPLLWPYRDYTATVSGSWACWGPDDQATDGDDTLHVVVYSEHRNVGHLDAIRGAVHAALAHTGIATNRLGGIADGYVTTAEDWSVPA